MPSSRSCCSTLPSAFDTTASFTPSAFSSRSASTDPGITRVHTPPDTNSACSSSAISSSRSGGAPQAQA